MRLYNINGKLQSKNVRKYLIDWGKPSRSKIQFKTKQFLKAFWENQIVYEEFPVYGSRMKVDFINATKRIAIEVNGPQHNNFNKFFHNNSRLNYLDHIKRDLEKIKWLELNKFKVLELEVEDVDKLSKDFIKSKYNIAI